MKSFRESAKYTKLLVVQLPAHAKPEDNFFTDLRKLLSLKLKLVLSD